MEISQYGKDSILIRGKKETVWFNPRKGDIDTTVGGARVIIFENAESNFLGLDSKSGVVIWGPGEYEVAGIEIWGTRIGEAGVMYVLQFEGTKVGWLSTLDMEITDKKKEKLSECDLLIVPGLGEIKDVWEKTKGLGESYLLITGLSAENQKKLLDLADREDLAPMEKLIISSENLPEITEVVLLTAK
jgi:hypothetical protein